MSFDASRLPFDPRKDFAGVVMQQRRVQLDSDWNEWLTIWNRRIQAGTMDIVGRAVVPATTPFGFKIGASTDANGAHHMTIGAGRMYVDGLLAENHGPPALAQWDPALAELSGAPQESPPGAPEVDLDFTQQPYLPGAALPTGNGPFLVYLDVWQRELTFLEDPDLIEKAVGVDTTGRVQTAWQVKLLDVSNVAGGVTCSTPDTSIPDWETLIAPPASRLTTDVAQSGTPGPCCLTPSTGYTGRENQLYRVEIHQGGGPNASGTPPSPAATFKWSRDNASVATAVTAISATTTKITKTATSQLTVESTGRDSVLGFSPGDWIEITDDVRELNGQAGDLRQIDVDGVDKTNKTIRLSAPVSADIQGHAPPNQPNRHTRIRRWDQGGKVYQSDGKTVWADLNAPNGRGDIPVPPKGTALILEDGVTVSFDLSPSNGSFRVGDHWTFAARTSDGSVEPLKDAPPQGIHHHYARLAVETFSNAPTDCRILWPPATTGSGATCACTVCVEVADHAKDPFAITKALNKVGVLGGGRVCLGPGTFPLGNNAVQMSKLSRVTLSGQGPATMLAYTGTGPAVVVDTCQQQRIEDLSITALPNTIGAVQAIPIGLLVRNSAVLAVERCSIQAPSTTGPIPLPGSAPSNSAAMSAVRGSAIALDGFLSAATFRDNILTADIGIATLASLAAVAKTTGASDAASLPPLGLIACDISDSVMFCPIAGVVLGDATTVQGLYTYMLENTIDGNIVVGGRFAGIFAEGLTDPGASVRISRNQLEVTNVGIDASLDGVIISDNVITQAKLMPPPPGGTGTDGIGIALRRAAGANLLKARVHRNRIGGIAGGGILLNGRYAALSIVDNRIEQAIGYGIQCSLPSDLLIRGNEVLNVTGPGLPELGIAGILAAATNTAVVQDNTVASIGNAAGQTESTGIFFFAISATATGNDIRDVGPAVISPGGSGPSVFGIRAGALDLNVSSNVILQAPPAAVSPNFVSSFTGIEVDGPPSGSLPTTLAVSLQDNVTEGWSSQPLIKVDQASGTAHCVITGNQCRNRTAVGIGNPIIISVSAGTAIVSNNHVQELLGIVGAPVTAIDVVVSETVAFDSLPAATALGNIASGDVRVNGQLDPRWKQLNIFVRFPPTP
jgi:hypothetical protein